MNVPGRNEKDLSVFANAINELARGATNAVSRDTFTLPTIGGTMTVECENCGPGALPRWVPITESAAAARVWFVSADRKGFTIRFNPDTAADRTFRFEMRRG